MTPLQLARRTLKYKIDIRVRRMLVRLPPDSPPCSPLSTLPSEHSTDDDSPPQNPKRCRRVRGRQRRMRAETPVISEVGASSSRVHTRAKSQPAIDSAISGQGAHALPSIGTSAKTILTGLSEEPPELYLPCLRGDNLDSNVRRRADVDPMLDELAALLHYHTLPASQEQEPEPAALPSVQQPIAAQQTQPTDPNTEEEQVHAEHTSTKIQQAKIGEFIQACQTPPNQPIVAATGYKRRAPIWPALHRSGPSTLPRRSKRLAKKEKVLPQHTIKRAQRRIMQNLGLLEADSVPSPEQCSVLDDLFKQPLSQRHIIALAELFAKGPNSAALQPEPLAEQGRLEQAWSDSRRLFFSLFMDPPDHLQRTSSYGMCTD